MDDLRGILIFSTVTRWCSAVAPQSARSGWQSCRESGGCRGCAVPSANWHSLSASLTLACVGASTARSWYGDAAIETRASDRSNYGRQAYSTLVRSDDRQQRVSSHRDIELRLRRSPRDAQARMLRGTRTRVIARTTKSSGLARRSLLVERRESAEIFRRTARYRLTGFTGKR